MQVAATNAQANANDAQYQAQQQQYQNQLQQNQSAQADYAARIQAYYSLRARHATERAAYRRGAWPATWREWRLQRDARLIGDRVEIMVGARVGTVEYVVRSSSGAIDALAMTLDNGKQVWIDENDIRYNRNGNVNHQPGSRRPLSHARSARLIALLSDCETRGRMGGLVNLTPARFCLDPSGAAGPLSPSG